MNNALAEFMLKRVEIVSIDGSGSYRDVGILEEYHHPWVRLRKPNGDHLCLPVYNIRLVKLVD